MPTGLLRCQNSGHYHFVTFSCYQRLPLLARGNAYDIVVRELEKIRRSYGLAIAGYVLMPEHIHLIASEPTNSSLAVALQVLKQQTSRKLKSSEIPQFWQRRYYDFNVYTAAKIVEKLKYMHRNPVRRGLVTSADGWPWSSFRHYATGEQGTIEIESHWTAQRREPENRTWATP
jgi:putative transposase